MADYLESFNYVSIDCQPTKSVKEGNKSILILLGKFIWPNFVLRLWRNQMLSNVLPLESSGVLEKLTEEKQ